MNIGTVGMVGIIGTRIFFNFLLILWDEWFHEPFIPANLSQYRERIDREFVEFPHMPELWGKPKYKVEA